MGLLSFWQLASDSRIISAIVLPCRIQRFPSPFALFHRRAGFRFRTEPSVPRRHVKRVIRSAGCDQQLSLFPLFCFARPEIRYRPSSSQMQSISNHSRQERPRGAAHGGAAAPGLFREQAGPREAVTGVEGHQHIEDRLLMGEEILPHGTDAGIEAKAFLWSHPLHCISP